MTSDALPDKLYRIEIHRNTIVSLLKVRLVSSINIFVTDYYSTAPYLTYERLQKDLP